MSWVNVTKQGKSQPITVFTNIAVTTTSSAIEATGFNSILIYATFSGAANWTFKLQGALESTDTYVDLYELANTGTMTLMSYQTDASRAFLFKGIPDYIKIVATEDVNGQTVSVKAQLLNF